MTMAQAHDCSPLLLQTLLVLAERRWLEVDAVDAVAQLSRAFHEAAHKSKLRRRAVRAHGFPPRLRVDYWKLCTNVQALVADVPAHETAAQSYMRFAGVASLSEAAVLESTGVEGEISRDVDRTFPTLAFFGDDADGRRQLSNVLKATAAHTPDVAYCQGMNYVAAVLLLLLNDADASGKSRAESPEETAFWLLVALIRHRGMRDVWRDKMPGLSRCIYLYNELLKVHFSDLYAHLRHIGMHPSFLATQWFVTLFARVLPAPSVHRVWDLFVLDGWKTLFRVALAITAHIRPQMLRMDMEQCSDFFRQHPRLGLDHVPIHALLATALTYKITRKMLAKMEDERHMEYLRLRLQKTPLSYEHSVLFPSLRDAQGNAAESLQLIRSQLAHFDSDVASDTVVLRQKIEASDRALVAATAALHEASYALSDATFALEDHVEAKQRLRAQFDALCALAVAEATAPNRPSRESTTARRALQLWSPAATLAYLNSRVFSCLERATWIALRSSRESEQQQDFDTERDDEEERKLAHLDILVPHLAADLRAIQRKMVANAMALHSAQDTYGRLQQRWQLARVALDELQQFKDRLSDQMLQLLLASEAMKSSKMQELFAEVDRS